MTADASETMGFAEEISDPLSALIWAETVYEMIDELRNRVREFRANEELMFRTEDREWVDRLHELKDFLDPFIRRWGGEAAPTLPAPPETVLNRRRVRTGTILSRLQYLRDDYRRTLDRYISTNAGFRNQEGLVASHKSRLDAVGQLVEDIARCVENIS